MAADALIVTVKRPKGEDGYKTFSVRLREPMVNRMDEISRETGRSRNELIGLFLEYALDHYMLEGGDSHGSAERA
ncbi:ribbon-helix-helix protein, CopG family [Pseudoflavonifractor sp. 60]|uniref:ribbon-helix-helix protein, CopG family n=1 Tax=Pseudoflavonifractor sp. 60 TaxID=2304576 RepID=UPI00136CABC7|nr:ribbon-helix-helix protein, CopG family [Pseudoflavonifractor sp. 60]